LGDTMPIPLLADGLSHALAEFGAPAVLVILAAAAVKANEIEDKDLKGLAFFFLGCLAVGAVLGILTS
jgi:hypothetical protein